MSRAGPTTSTPFATFIRSERGPRRQHAAGLTAATPLDRFTLWGANGRPWPTYLAPKPARAGQLHRLPSATRSNLAPAERRQTPGGAEGSSTASFSAWRNGTTETTVELSVVAGRLVVRAFPQVLSPEKRQQSCSMPRSPADRYYLSRSGPSWRRCTQRGSRAFGGWWWLKGRPPTSILTGGFLASASGKGGASRRNSCPLGPDCRQNALNDYIDKLSAAAWCNPSARKRRGVFVSRGRQAADSGEMVWGSSSRSYGPTGPACTSKVSPAHTAAQLRPHAPAWPAGAGFCGTVQEIGSAIPTIRTTQQYTHVDRDPPAGRSQPVSSTPARGAAPSA